MTATRARLTSTRAYAIQGDAISSCDYPFQTVNQLADRHLWREVKQYMNVIRLPVKFHNFAFELLAYVADNPFQRFQLRGVKHLASILSDKD